MATAMAVPSSVPAVKPTTVSRHEVPMCRHRSPLCHKLCRVPAMRLGLLVRKPSLRPSRVVSSHRANRPASRHTCHSRIDRFLRR